MKNLLVITQKVDENDDHRGSFIDWLKEFAKNFDNVLVVTLAEGSYSLPKNVKVYSLGKEYGVSKWIQAVHFYRYLSKIIPDSSGIFAYASPIFIIAAWPLAFVFRKKMILWYLHRAVPFKLKIAEKLCYKIVTAAKESIKLRSNKIIETGHGINLDLFTTERGWTDNFTAIISVGRISSIKGLETLIEAVKILKENNLVFDVKIIGQPVMPEDEKYLSKLKTMSSDLILEELIAFEGFAPYPKMPEIYKKSDILVNLAPAGGIDKVILEAMASGMFVLTSNAVFKKYFGEYGLKLIFRHGDSKDLADKIQHLISLPSSEKADISKFLVESVKTHHRLDQTIMKISEIIKA